MNAKYRCETDEGLKFTATLQCPQGFDPPPVIMVPINPTYGGGLEVFELDSTDNPTNRPKSSRYEVEL